MEKKAALLDKMSDKVSIIRIPMCELCEHFLGYEEKMSCKAYPKGIPEEYIWSSEEETKNRVCSENYRYTENTR